jgi:Tfp pilus assembly protein PilX
MNRTCQKGVALILTLILVFVLSVMAVSLMFVAQTETWSSFNYRMMSQARDGAEAGVNASSGYIVNNYTEPGGTGGSSSYNHSFSIFPVTYASTTSSDPTSTYNLTVSPVTYNGAPVILSADSTQSNYPVAAVQTAFNTNGVGFGNIAAGGAKVNYSSHATLMSMKSAFIPFGKPTPTTVQTWKITSQGSITGIRGATVSITATLEQHVNPTFNYAAFATDTGCSALQFGGGGTTDSYDSTAALTGGKPVTATNTGNVGTNGNLATNGNPTTINGTLSTPRMGVGTCSSGNVTAWTDTSGHVTQGLVELPQTVVYPTPTIPVAGTVNVTSNGSCPAVATMVTTGGACATSGNGSNGIMTLAPAVANGTVSLHTLSLTGNNDLHLAAGTYNIDSLSETGSTQLVLDSTPVIINVTGSGGGTVVDLTGGGLTNTSGSFNPMTFQILYAGTGTISLKGGAAAAGLLYAPNATFSFAGNSDWYGAVIGKDMTDMGGTAVHYDRRLKNSAYSVGPWMLDSFSWKKF